MKLRSEIKFLAENTCTLYFTFSDSTDYLVHAEKRGFFYVSIFLYIGVMNAPASREGGLLSYNTCVSEVISYLAES